MGQLEDYRDGTYDRKALKDALAYMANHRFCLSGFGIKSSNVNEDLPKSDPSRYNCKCGICGEPAYQGIGPVKCSNRTCKNTEAK